MNMQNNIARTVNNEFVNAVNKAARYNVIANAARKMQREKEFAQVECYAPQDFDDVIECVNFTNDTPTQE